MSHLFLGLNAKYRWGKQRNKQAETANSQRNLRMQGILMFTDVSLCDEYKYLAKLYMILPSQSFLFAY